SIAHDGRPGHRRLLAPRALHVARAAQVLELFLDLVDATLDLAPVELDLLLARALGAVAPAALARQSLVGMHEARHGILELRELDLEDRLLGAGAARENPNDQLVAVVGLEPRKFLPVALLGRRELMIEENGVGGLGLCRRDDLVCLARPEEEGRAPLADA